MTDQSIDEGGNLSPGAFTDPGSFENGQKMSEKN